MEEKQSYDNKMERKYHEFSYFSISDDVMCRAKSQVVSISTDVQGSAQ